MILENCCRILQTFESDKQESVKGQTTQMSWGYGLGAFATECEPGKKDNSNSEMIRY